MQASPLASSDRPATLAHTSGNSKYKTSRRFSGRQTETGREAAKCIVKDDMNVPVRRSLQRTGKDRHGRRVECAPLSFMGSGSIFSYLSKGVCKGGNSFKIQTPKWGTYVCEGKGDREKVCGQLFPQQQPCNSLQFLLYCSVRVLTQLLVSMGQAMLAGLSGWVTVGAAF